ncbi:MAG: phosphatidylinositol mannoside acyltransferase [Actinomycetaceae bacterium]|nr:phosphatidylinositol mannoside acyltransferase [Actinomycetaceae bacterium]
MNIDRFVLPAFRAAGHLPPSVAERAGRFVGNVIGRLPITPVRQMAANHARICSGQLPPRHVYRAVASYFTMFAQTPVLTRMSDDELKRAVRCHGCDALRQGLSDGPVIVALTHSGNWDLAGAWACEHLAPVVTVAEELQPRELYDYFVSERQALGMEILPARRGVFHLLKERVTGRRVIVPLLADRDITGAGIEVTLAGQQALVAAGPAALAIALNRPLFAAHMRMIPYRFEGRARTGIEIFFKPVTVSEDVEETTRAWVGTLEPIIRKYLVDWHMMQPLFVDDLDPQRLARARARHAQAQREGSRE